MNTETVAAFDEQAAEAIRQNYNLTNNNVNKWRLRGSIPKMYQTEALLISVRNKDGIIEKRPLFNWRVRLGLPLLEILDLLSVSRATLNKWEQGRGLPRNGGGYEEIVEKLTNYIQSNYNYAHGIKTQ